MYASTFAHMVICLERSELSITHKLRDSSMQEKILLRLVLMGKSHLIATHPAN